MREFLDLIVVCQRRRFEVHRAVVCAASPALRAALFRFLVEVRVAEYEVKKSTPEAMMETMLRFLHTGALSQRGVATEEKGTTKARVLAEGVLAPLLGLAVQYELGPLCKRVVEQLSDGFTVKNVAQRTKALKRHRKHEKVRPAWEKLMAVLEDLRIAVFEEE